MVNFCQGLNMSEQFKPFIISWSFWECLLLGFASCRCSAAQMEPERTREALQSTSAWKYYAKHLEQVGVVGVVHGIAFENGETRKPYIP